MAGADVQWVWQHADWPRFRWQDAAVQPLLRGVWRKQGLLLGKAEVAEQPEDPAVALDTLLANIVSSSAIEDERLNVQSVRSSLAKRLGLEQGVSYPTSNRSEGLAELMLDAVSKLDVPLSLEQLLQWHRWLFPEDAGLLYRVRVGALRGEEPMQVVSGRLDRPTVHFEAPPRSELGQELGRFIEWFNSTQRDLEVDPLLRAAITHFWFVTLHPFDDGNGRLTRALTDRALAQADNLSVRLYAMSSVILEKRQEYYRALECSQRGGVDITEWIVWFLQTLEAALDEALTRIERTLAKARFWRRHQADGLSTEQLKVLNRLLDGEFEQGINASKYRAAAKVSKATATRHLTDLLEKECLEKLPGGGRSTRYRIRYPDE